MTCPHSNQKWTVDMKSGTCMDCGEAMQPLPPLPLDHPSGTLLAHTGSGTNWVKAHELPRVVLAMAKNTMAEAEHRSAVAKMWRLKYIRLDVDMRGGNFTIRDQNGERIDGLDDVLRALGIQ